MTKDQLTEETVAVAKQLLTAMEGKPNIVVAGALFAVMMSSPELLLIILDRIERAGELLAPAKTAKNLDKSQN